ncbi:MAG: type I methionyl aminopeptidase [Deltaproteobacteria bacterium]|nr:type I methionyl aminopeptidase [Deltaproteobacteria bacterium]
MIALRSRRELDRLRTANQLVAEVLELMRGQVSPGVTTGELDRRAEAAIVAAGARPAFKGYAGFPATLCTSINAEIVHGIPSDRRRLVEGDIISIDVGVCLEGYYGDAAITVPVGQVSAEALRLIEVTRESLHQAIAWARPGERLFTISHSVQAYAEKHGFSVVRDFVGHGIGTELHEPPQIPNYGRAGTGILLKPGMVLAIEPMINQGGHGVQVLADGWTAVTRDRKLSAHFEHTVAVTDNGPEILSRMADSAVSA